MAISLVPPVPVPTRLTPIRCSREESFEGERLNVAVALTVDREAGETLHVTCGADVPLDPAAERLLFDCCALHRRVDLTLVPGRDRGICMRMLYGVVAALFRAVDRAAAAGAAPPSADQLRYFEAELGRARTYYERAAQRHAQLRYFAGMLAGLVVAAALVPLLLAGLAAAPGLGLPASMMSACLAAGAVGALVSVMSGITSGSLRLHTLVLGGESGSHVLFAAGTMRPVLGAAFGLMLFVLVNSTLLPLELPQDEAQQTFFYVAIAFVAGFSERWARGIVAGTEERLGGREPQPAAGSTGAT